MPKNWPSVVEGDEICIPGYATVIVDPIQWNMPGDMYETSIMLDLATMDEPVERYLSIPSARILLSPSLENTLVVAINTKLPPRVRARVFHPTKSSPLRVELYEDEDERRKIEDRIQQKAREQDDFLKAAMENVPKDFAQDTDKKSTVSEAVIIQNPTNHWYDVIIEHPDHFEFFTASTFEDVQVQLQVRGYGHVSISSIDDPTFKSMFAIKHWERRRKGIAIWPK